MPGVAKQVFLATDTDQADEGGRPDAAGRHDEDLLGDGQDFDPAKPEDYINSFAIKRT